MGSIAVTKPDTGVLSRQSMVLSPFGVLAQAFSEELLARAGFEEGRYPFRRAVRPAWGPVSRKTQDILPAAPAAELAYSGREQTQAGQERPEAGQRAAWTSPEQTLISPPGAALRATPAVEPLELAYSVQSRTRDNPGGAVQGRPGGREEAGFVRGLPDWAQRFLREGAPQSVTETARQMGAAREIRSVQGIAAPAAFEQRETFEWTAPDYRSPARIEYRETPQQEERPDIQNLRISDAELRRTADRVYQIIEDRIRRERRRIGL